MRAFLVSVALAVAVQPLFPASGNPAPRSPHDASTAVTVEQLLERYVAALGGRHAIEAVRTRVSRGFLVNPSGQRAPLEIYEKAPDHFRIVMDVPAGRSENGFDGSVAWTRRPGDVAEERPVADAAFVIREHRLDRPLVMRSLYAHLRVVGPKRLDGRDVIVLEAAGEDSIVESWSFDAKTWLPAKMELTVRGTPIQVWFEDYRRVGGVKVPFRIRRARPDFAWTNEFTSIEQNVPLDDRQFTKPVTP